MKLLIENWRKFVNEEEDKSKEEEEFKPHMMYDPETGEGKKAENTEDHVKMDKKGWVHDKPDIDEAKNKDGKEQGVDGKACWKGYRHAGTEGGKDKCVKMKEEQDIEYYHIIDATYDDGTIVEDLEFWDDIIEEAEYQGRKVTLNKPTKGDVKKSKVYVKNAKGNVIKVNFGDPNMRIKKSNPKRRKSFRARHNCDNPGPKTKARYWSCRAW